MAQPRLVIGLDFGTTYTGVAYCDKENAPTDQIAVVNEWPGIGAVGNKEKAPSRIAYVPPPPGQTTGGTIVWGDLIKPRIKAPVHACMKLRLDDKQAGSRQLALLMRILTSDMGGLDMNDIDEALAGNGGAPPAYPGKDVVEIVADYLSLVRDTAYQTMRNRYGGVFDGMRKELVVTVPAVWSERAKDQTMKAVAKAEWGVSKTSMITEPEAAAIYTLRGMSESSNKTEMKVGDTFVLCDAGGGTVDLISYKITQVSPAFHVEEAAVGSGDKCGATYVEKEFLNWLEEWLGTERFNRIPAEKTRHGSVMINEFEMNKCQFTGSDNDMAIRLPSEAGIMDDDDLQIEDGSLFMNAEQMQKIFDPCVNRVLELVDGQVAAVMKAGHGKPKMVFLVGGFGRNIYLFKKIQEYCTARGMQTRQPAHPWSAVARGAVCRGLETGSSGLVAVRLARKFYGTPVSRVFNPSIHSTADMITDEYTGRKMAKAQMAWLVEKSDRLPEDTPKEITIAVSAHFTLDEERQLGAILAGCSEDVAPSRFADDCEYLGIFLFSLSFGPLLTRCASQPSKSFAGCGQTSATSPSSASPDRPTRAQARSTSRWTSSCRPGSRVAKSIGG
ncbi:hypothetical protein RB601_006754 [Gaeumannomyces tritici]